MCGIVGGRADKIDERLAKIMTETLKHRGPDSDGIWFSPDKNVFFGHTRLSIIDLSPAGNQPLCCLDKNSSDFVEIVFNGEIYNYREVMDELKNLGWTFVGHSDTEVVAKSFLQWGENCVERFRGMFAFAVYRSRDQKIYIFRDRFGVKPIYYYLNGRDFVFASELKAIFKYPGHKKDICQEALESYFRFGYIPGPLTIFKNTFKLDPGSFLVVDKDWNVSRQVFWNPGRYFTNEYWDYSENDTLDKLEGELEKSFAYRLVADVDVGLFLSGGVDSSLLAALLQKKQTKKIKTFTVGFSDKQYDEAPFARQIAKVLGTDHQELYINEQDILSGLEDYFTIFDEPFGDSSGLPTYLLSKFARKSVKVVLSGDGGDELFFGYSKYQAVLKLSSLSVWKKELLKSVLRVSPDKLAGVYNIAGHFLGLPEFSNVREKISKLEYVMNGNGAGSTDYFLRAGSYWREDELSRLFNGHQSVSSDKFSRKLTDNIGEDMQLHDLIHYLPDDILVKTDRATMAVGLEAREPYLDQDILSFSAKINPKLKFKNPGQKYILRQLLFRHLDHGLFDNRPKTGFRPPIYNWLKSELSAVLEERLSPVNINSDGIFNSEYIKNIFKQWHSGKYFNPDKLWLLLVFSWWRKKYFDV